MRKVLFVFVPWRTISLIAYSGQSSGLKFITFNKSPIYRWNGKSSAIIGKLHERDNSTKRLRKNKDKFTKKLRLIYRHIYSILTLRCRRCVFEKSCAWSSDLRQGSHILRKCLPNISNVNAEVAMLNAGLVTNFYKLKSMSSILNCKM